MTAKKIIAQVAKQNGISYEECYEEMRKAILEGFYSDDPEAKKKWATLRMRGSEPTPEEVICAISRNVKKKMKSR